jgi:hypothetical protein
MWYLWVYAYISFFFSSFFPGTSLVRKWQKMLNPTTRCLTQPRPDLIWESRGLEFGGTTTPRNGVGDGNYSLQLTQSIH